mmetsp:Transcript_18354/g.22038  ORF Transcript_18354/g.22038 Transcript_18354/m.22038 type:complete len:914 (+) Transcript_18354:656-3397(+)
MTSKTSGKPIMSPIMNGHNKVFPAGTEPNGKLVENPNSNDLGSRTDESANAFIPRIAPLPPDILAPLPDTPLSKLSGATSPTLQSLEALKTPPNDFRPPLPSLQVLGGSQQGGHGGRYMVDEEACSPSDLLDDLVKDANKEPTCDVKDSVRSMSSSNILKLEVPNGIHTVNHEENNARVDGEKSKEGSRRHERDGMDPGSASLEDDHNFDEDSSPKTEDKTNHQNGGPRTPTPSVTSPRDLADMTQDELMARQRGYQRWQRVYYAVVQELNVKKAQEAAKQRYGEEDELPGKSKKFMLIRVESDVRMTWDVIQVLVLLYVALLVPFRVCFNVEVHGPAFIFDLLVDAYFIVDIFVNFCSELRLEKDMEMHIIDKHKEIALHYLQGWFTLDILACLPLDYIARVKEGRLLCSFTDTCKSETEIIAGEGESAGGALKLLKLLRAFRLLKLVRLVRISRILARYEYKLVYWMHVLAALKVVGVTTLFSHWMGCFYGMVYDWDDSPNEYNSVMERWMVCFYWATQTTTTVGYGDHTSSSMEGQLVSVVAMMLGGVIFSWFMSSIFAVLNPDPKKQEITQTMQYVVQYLQSNKLPQETAGRVLAFYKKHNRFHFDDKQLLDSLPVVLQQEIFELLYARTVRCTPVFMDMSDDGIISLCMLVSPTVAPMHDIIFQPGDPSTDMYMIVSGETAAVYSERIVDHVRQGILYNPTATLNAAATTFTLEGALFGEESLFGARKRLELVIVKSPIAKLLKVPADGMNQYLKDKAALRESMQLAYMSRLISFGSQASHRNFIRQTGLVKDLLDENTGGIKFNWKQILQDKNKDPWGIGNSKLGRRSMISRTSSKRYSVMNVPGLDGNTPDSSSQRREVSFNGKSDMNTAKLDSMMEVMMSMKNQIDSLSQQVARLESEKAKGEGA